MADVIQLLPDAIANQIAAGEVIQRPASVVKELVENAIDAGSNNIQVIIKDAGKTLIQVIDNGCGMSETDARLSFERHATSKIRMAKDLFAIRTMGFRGEALASIAAVAQVEMRTRQAQSEVGTRLLVEGSECKLQEPCTSPPGTSFSVKNLFYNVPARRNFLKSNPVEMRHIIDEFQRIAIAHPDVFFSLHHNQSELFHLTPGNLRQRMVAILGNNANPKLVPVNEETDILKISGFVGKPEFAKKTRGDQWLYVNQRFIKSGYLNHAVAGAYEDLLPADSFPMYVLLIEIDPARIDINVHPTKQEIKFDDDRLVYNYLKVAVRHALGQHNVTPTLDFDQDPGLHHMTSQAYRPFPQQQEHNASTAPATRSGSGVPNYTTPEKRAASNLQHWEKLFEVALPQEEETAQAPTSVTIESKWSDAPTLDDNQQSFSREQKEPYQVHGTFIISQIKSGFLLIDQQAAHERILFEQYMQTLERQKAVTQKALFPRNVHLSPADAALLREILPEIQDLGFEISEFGSNTFIIGGIPADWKGSVNEEAVIELLLEQYKANLELKLPARENIARSMARSAAIKRGQLLTGVEMRTLIDQLFACEVPFASPAGRPCFLTFELDELLRRFMA